MGTPRVKILGTGFAVAKGQWVATNAHVVDQALDPKTRQHYAVFAGSGDKITVIPVTVIAKDEDHDLAILALSGAKLPPMVLNTRWYQDGTEIAFTGFPIGAVLGLYPVTHKGIISARTPIAIPADHSSQLSIQKLKRLREPFLTYQLDATAYPGNSGSPVYEQNSGEVIAIVNKVFVKETKEDVLRDPSHITYAIPTRYLQQLLDSIE
ncbi:S1 family peptidase [Saliniradius amylolyticus]|nr:serine protease [Saliniradius amylolyticus]